MDPNFGELNTENISNVFRIGFANMSFLDHIIMHEILLCWAIWEEHYSLCCTNINV